LNVQLERSPFTNVIGMTRSAEEDNNMAYHSESSPEHRPVVTKTEARQGVTGHNVRYVLGFGLVAVIVAFAVIYYIYFG
jgi:hypothetical protein